MARPLNFHLETQILDFEGDKYTFSSNVFPSKQKRHHIAVNFSFNTLPGQNGDSDKVYRNISLSSFEKDIENVKLIDRKEIIKKNWFYNNHKLSAKIVFLKKLNSVYGNVFLNTGILREQNLLYDEKAYHISVFHSLLGYSTLAEGSKLESVFSAKINPNSAGTSIDSDMRWASVTSAENLGGYMRSAHQLNIDERTRKVKSLINESVFDTLNQGVYRILRFYG